MHSVEKQETKKEEPFSSPHALFLENYGNCVRTRLDASASMYCPLSSARRPRMPFIV